MYNSSVNRACHLGLIYRARAREGRAREGRAGVGAARARVARAQPARALQRAAAGPMERPEKLRRLSRMRADLPFMHQTAMAKFLKTVRDEGHPGLSRRQDITDAQELVLDVDTPYGKLLQDMKVGNHEVEVAAPAAILWHCSRLPAMVPLWEAAMEFPRPWHVIFYGDEIGAGNTLAHVQNRKSWGVYWTIAEFGPQALACDDPRARSVLLQQQCRFMCCARAWVRM